MGKVKKQEAVSNKKLDISKKVKSIEKAKKSKLPTTEKANSPANRVKTTSKVTAKSVSSNVEESGTPSSQEDKDRLTIKPTKSNIVVGLDALFEVVKKTKDSGENKELFEDDKIQLQFKSIKVPKCPTRTARILLPHSILPETAEVCFIVPDLKKGRKIDSEPTVHHYEDLLRKAGVEKLPKIMPLNMLRTEFNQFELKRRLVTQYDTFLVDGRISGYVFHLLGSVFTKRHKSAFPVRVKGAKDLKREIQQSLQRVSISLNSVADTKTIEIGNLKMDKENIADNVLAAMEWLTKNYPGGWDNIRNMLIKTTRSMAIPIYWSLKDKNEVNIPVVISQKRKNQKTVEGELSTMPGTKVKVSSDGKITVKKPRRTKSKKVEEKDKDISEDDDDMDIYDIEDDSEDESENESGDETDEVKTKQEVKSEDTDEDDDDSDAELEDAEDNYLQTYEKEQSEINNKIKPEPTEVKKENQKQQNLKNKNANKSPKKGKNNKNKANKIAGIIKTESKGNSSQSVSPAKKGGNNVPKVGTTPSPKANKNKKGVKRLQ